jgi:predicted CoA-substrate-specific enzyme activase
MILGIDVGTCFTKGALLQDGKLIWRAKTLSEASPSKAVNKIFEVLKNEKGILESDLEDVILTGWGHAKIPGREKNELVDSLARGAKWDQPSSRAVLCMGCQESIVAKFDSSGRVTGYVRNDKCASGAGKFIEIICEALECKVEDTAAIASRADKKIRISNQCAVFTESEVVSLVNDGETIENIVDAILTALTVNIASLCKRIIKNEPLVLAGGLARNKKVCALIQDAVPVRTSVFLPEADYIAAIGAALSRNGEGR